MNSLTAPDEEDWAFGKTGKPEIGERKEILVTTNRIYIIGVGAISGIKGG